ncbi:hypothetical protein [Thiocapsa bogorovii]|uniref:hypothetical protein n=1 Tax=Thiocapsa bogorovii TaxID=521689 RepID=UPI001E45C082|nr:hypothetical protein [Thiocapsa bogorovii]UHD17559.1 hypothetical protein LT988_05775 [Thiocapsa bogorovii]
MPKWGALLIIAFALLDVGSLLALITTEALNASPHTRALAILMGPAMTEEPARHCQRSRTLPETTQ